MGFLFMRGRNVTTRADRIGDFQINSASYGETVPVVLGTTRLSGNIIQWEDFTAHEHRHTQRTGKGGGSKSTQIDYTYTVAVAIGLCSGPISGIGQVWRDKEKYYYPNENIQLTAYLGTHDQQPWSYTQSKHPDRALPYSGLAYMAGVVDLGNSGSLPTFNFEVKGKLLDTGDGVDVNPADYIKYIIEQVGVKDVVIDGLEHFRSYCANADLLISSPPDGKAKKAHQIITEIAELCNCYLFWSNDRLKIVPLADKPIGAWSPYNQIVYDLTEDDLLSGTDGRLVEYKRKTSSESYNQATVEFINRANSYEKETVSFDILADVQKNGLKPAPSTQAHYIYTKKRATFLAQQLAMKRLYERNQYTFKLDWAFCRLEPGDLVTLTEASCGLNKQVVIITEVQEATDGELTITAVGKPPAIYSPASIDVHENERPFTDYNAPATAVSDVTFIQPPLEVATNGRELWLGVSAEYGWGGCNLWVSDSNDQYRNIGTIRQTARIGKLVAPMGASDTSCTVRMVNGNLQSGTHVDAERGNTLCYIGGECLSYEGARLNNDGTITLSGLIRGQYNTVATNHGVGDKLTRLDESLYRQVIKEDDIGKTVYVKPTSFNIFGGMEQDIAEVEPFTYTLKPYYIPEVSNYNLTTIYHALGGKAINYDLVANFEPPNLTTLDTVQAWYREGSAEKWRYGGDGRGRIVMSGLDVGKTYTVKLVVKDSYGNTSEGVQLTKTITLKTDTPNAVEGVAVRFSDQAIVTWREVQNADVDFYEVRLTMNPGQDDGLLAKVSSTTASVNLERRKGTIYVYAHNPIKGYSSPSILTYNVTEPPLPNNVRVKSQIGGIAVTFGVIPSNSSHANVYVNEQVYQTTANSLYVPLEPNVYEVSVSYVDMFGEGKRTNAVQVAVKETIGKELLDTESLGLDDIDKAIDRLDNQVTNLDGSINSRISTATSSIQSDLDSTKGKVSNLQNQYDTTARWAQQAHQRINTALDGVNAIDGKIATAKTEVLNQANNHADNAIRNISNDITTLNRTVDSRIATAKGEVLKTANNYVDTQVKGINSNINSRITQLNDEITSTVNNSISGMNSRITQMENGIQSTVNNATKGITSRVTQLEHTVNTSLVDDMRGLSTSINTSIDGIKSTVTAQGKQIGTVQSSVTQLSNSIDSKVANSTKGLSSRITQLEDGIQATVTNLKSNVSTQIAQLDSAIGIKVANATSGLSSKVTQLENSVNTTITSKLQGLETKVNATVNGIQSTVAEYKKSSDNTLDYAKAVMAMSRSPQLMVDPTFMQASNNQHFEIARYSRLGASGQDVAFKYSRPNLNITNDTGGMAFGCQTVQGKITDIGYGGFSVKPNGRVLVGGRAKTYIIRIIAQVDNDCTIELNNNELSGGRIGWITSNQGTGKYEEYIGYWTYGNGTAKPDSIGFVYVKPKNGKGRGAGRWFIWVTTVEVYESNAYDNSIATVKSSITQLSNSIDMKVANATNGLSSRITQLDNAIKAQVIDGGKVMSALTLYNGGARIDGKLLHVTGKSLFDDNIVTNKMIQANAVTADKLSVGSLSAISATIGTLRTKTSGARVEIKDNLIEVYDDNNRLRVRMGVW